MGFRLHAVLRASLTARQATSKSVQIPKGYVAVYAVVKHKHFLYSTNMLSRLVESSGERVWI